MEDLDPKKRFEAPAVMIPTLEATTSSDVFVEQHESSLLILLSDQDLLGYSSIITKSPWYRSTQTLQHLQAGLVQSLEHMTPMDLGRPTTVPVSETDSKDEMGSGPRPLLVDREKGSVLVGLRTQVCLDRFGLHHAW